MSRENAVRSGSYPVADLWISEVNMKSARPAELGAALPIAAPELAAAQGIPLPQPAPRSRNQPARPPALPTDAAGRPVPVRPGEAVPYDGSQSQRVLVDRVSTYLSSLQTLIGDFVQIGPDGGRSIGKFYIQKPGRVRFDYDPPSPIELIADGSSVVVRDRNLATQDLYPLSQTPLRYLLAEQIDLARDTNLVAVSQDNTFITVTIEETQILIGTHLLQLMFGAKDTQFRQWTVTDPHRYETTVAVHNLHVSHQPVASQLTINYGISGQ